MIRYMTYSYQTMFRSTLASTTANNALSMNTSSTSTTCVQRCMASYISSIRKNKKNQLQVGPNNHQYNNSNNISNHRHDDPTSSSSLSLFDRIQICPSKVAKILNWHLSSLSSKCNTNTNMNNIRPLSLPTILSMYIYVDRIDIMKVSYNMDHIHNTYNNNSHISNTTSTTTNVRDVPWWRKESKMLQQEEDEQPNHPWWYTGTSTDNNNNDTNSSSSSSSTSIIQSIPIQYSICNTTKLRKIHNATSIVHQLRQLLYEPLHETETDIVPHDNTGLMNTTAKSTASTSQTVYNYNNNITKCCNNNNNILLIGWPIRSKTGGRKGYDCGRIVYILEQLFNTKQHNWYDSSISSNNNSQENHHQYYQAPYICLYDPNRISSDEDEWGRSPSHTFHYPTTTTTTGEDNIPKKPMYIHPPYRSKEQNYYNNYIDHSYDPQALWTSFCNHYWPLMNQNHNITSVVKNTSNINNNVVSTNKIHHLNHDICQDTSLLSQQNVVEPIDTMKTPVVVMNYREDIFNNNKIDPSRLPIKQQEPSLSSTSNNTNQYRTIPSRTTPTSRTNRITTTPLAAKRFVNFGQYGK